MSKRKLHEQVIVITGASSGIGLCTAKLAAQRGARVALTARSNDALAAIAQEICAAGGQAIQISGDVADESAMERVARRTCEAFGRIDTWVNNAGVTMYGEIEQVRLDDMRRLFDVTFWGTVHGCLAALPHLRQSHGTLINIGSIESSVPIPLNGAYAAAKHAVRAFTSALRMELEHDRAQVGVTLIKPGPIDTPLFQHARNYLDADPEPPPPVYDPEVVARAILRCAEHPVAEIVIGGPLRAEEVMMQAAPRLMERALRSTMLAAQKGERPNDGDNLYAPSGSPARERGRQRGHVLRRSAYTRARLGPMTTTIAGIGLGVLAGAATRALRRS
jgi:short-subunit dehydrogenase